MLLSYSVLGWAEEIWTALLLLWSPGNDKEMWANQKHLEDKRKKRDRYLYPPQSHTNGHLWTNRREYACSHMHKVRKPRQRHAHRRDTAIFNVPVWLMSPESPCLGCKSLDFCSSLFCLVIIWEQTCTHTCTHMLTVPHKPLQLLWWK